MSKKYSNNEFIEKVNQINQTIDLSGFNYINSKTKGLCKYKTNEATKHLAKDLNNEK